MKRGRGNEVEECVNEKRMKRGQGMPKPESTIRDTPTQFLSSNDHDSDASFATHSSYSTTRPPPIKDKASRNTAILNINNYLSSHNAPFSLMEQNNDAVLEEISNMEKVALELEENLQGLISAPSLKEFRERDKTVLEEDIRKFHVVIDQINSNIMAHQEYMEKMETELKVKNSENQRTRAKDEELKKTLDAQMFNLRGVERMRRGIRVMDREISDAEAARNEWEEKSWDLDATMAQKLKELESLSIVCNQAIRRDSEYFGDERIHLRSDGNPAPTPSDGAGNYYSLPQSKVTRQEGCEARHVHQYNVPTSVLVYPLENNSQLNVAFYFHGTACLGFSLGEVLILAGDSRLTTGNKSTPQVRHVLQLDREKLKKVSKKIYYVAAGDVANLDDLWSSVQKATTNTEGDITWTKDIKSVVDFLHEKSAVKSDDFCTSVLVGGYNETSKRLEIHSINRHAMMLETGLMSYGDEFGLVNTVNSIVGIGTGGKVAEDFLLKKVKSDLSTTEAIDVALEAIFHAGNSDICSGGTIQVVCLTKDSCMEVKYDPWAICERFVGYFEKSAILVIVPHPHQVLHEVFKECFSHVLYTNTILVENYWTVFRVVFHDIEACSAAMKKVKPIKMLKVQNGDKFPDFNRGVNHKQAKFYVLEYNVENIKLVRDNGREEEIEEDS